MDERDKQVIFQRSRPNKTYIGSPFQDFQGRRLRIANKFIDGQGGYDFANVKDEIVLRQTDAARFQIKATFIEDDRSFQTITIQKFTNKGNARESFTFLPDEIARLLKFLSDLKRVHFPNAGKINITDNELEGLLLRPEQARVVMASNPKLLAMLAREEVTDEDIVALGYRKKQLAIFHRLLTDADFFAAKEREHPKGPEQVWQKFFEHNQWIFGYGLSIIYFEPLQDRALETRVTGSSVLGPGKTVDALLKSQAQISTTSFVEIKRHDTPLVEPTAYRAGIWQPSKELTGAVAQIQGTVAAALDLWRPQEQITDKEGNPTGETLFTTEPRSYVVVGRLSEFQSEHGINSQKFRSFELYRRNLLRPEIITFDELYQRARYIVEAETQTRE